MSESHVLDTGLSNRCGSGSEALGRDVVRFSGTTLLDLELLRQHE